MPGEAVAVTSSVDFRRIRGMPRRALGDLFSPALAANVTRLLRLPSGTMSLFPEQAAALVEGARRGGFFGPMGVSAGKTLTAFLFPTVLEQPRAVLLVDGGLVKKTERDFRDLRLHWRETPLTILSYERIARGSNAGLLEHYDPRLIIADECQALRNDCSTRRVVEDFIIKRKPIFCCMSASMTGESIIDCAHLARWALGDDNNYLPNDPLDLDFWRRALDASVEEGNRMDPGVLLEFATDEDKGTRMQRARAGVRRRMLDTTGVVATHKIDVAASLRLSPRESPQAVAEEHWERLREDGVLPNGELCLDALEEHREARNFDHGYYGIWNPAPPDDWYDARKLWAKVVRKAIKSRWCNTEVEARAVCETWGPLSLSEHEDGTRKQIDPVAARDAWLYERARLREDGKPYKPNPEAVWMSTAKLEAVAAWAHEHRKEGGIIWTQHRPFGYRLERDYGLPYYRQKGLNSSGEYIEDAPAGSVIVASIDANFTGRNLQHKWHRGLMVSPYGSAERWEQNLGREHRRGQPKDTVFFDVMIGCHEHVSALRRAKERAAYIQQTMGNEQKLCYCDWTIDLDAYRDLPGWRWHTKSQDETDADEAIDFGLDDETFSDDDR